MIRRAAAERFGADASKTAHETAIETERQNAFREMGRLARPDVAEPRELGRAHGIEIADHRGMPVDRARDLFELATQHELAMREVDVDDLDPLEAQNLSHPGIARAFRPGMRQRQDLGLRQRRRAPRRKAVNPPRQRPPGIIAADLRRQRVDLRRRLLHQQKIRAVRGDEGRDVVDRGADPSQQIPAQNAEGRRSADD